MENDNTKLNSGLSTTSLVVSIIAFILCLTIIGASIGVPLAILGLILGIVALAQKQKKGAAITSIIISGLIILVTTTIIIIGGIFVKNTITELTPSLTELGEMIENDPEMQEMLNDPLYEDKLETVFEDTFKDTFKNGINMDTLTNIKFLLLKTIDKMGNTMQTMKSEYLLDKNQNSSTGTIDNSTGINEEISICTMDVKICSDGSVVGRSGPDCEFESCPEEE